VTTGTARPLRSRRVRLILAGACAALLVVGYLLAPESARELPQPPEAPAPIFRDLVGTREPPALAETARDTAAIVAPLVVSLSNASNPQATAALGLVVSRDGDVLTAASAIRSRTLDVQLSDGRSIAGDVTLFDPDADLAIVRVHGVEKLQAVKAAAPPPLAGDLLIAAGRLRSGPLIATTLIATVTNGSYALAPLPAVCPPGTPLFTADGGAAGILVDVREARAARLGAALERVRETIARGPALPVGIGATFNGTIVETVSPGSPAEQGRLVPGDVITAVNGTPIGPDTDLTHLVRELPEGADADFTFERRGRRRTATIVPASLVDAPWR